MYKKHDDLNRHELMVTLVGTVKVCTMSTFINFLSYLHGQTKKVNHWNNEPKNDNMSILKKKLQYTCIKEKHFGKVLWFCLYMRII
jgi:hypothetical protein